MIGVHGGSGAKDGSQLAYLEQCQNDRSGAIIAFRIPKSCSFDNDYRLSLYTLNMTNHTSRTKCINMRIKNLQEDTECKIPCGAEDSIDREGM
jgi:hypothetical protein